MNYIWKFLSTSVSYLSHGCDQNSRQKEPVGVRIYDAHAVRRDSPCRQNACCQGREAGGHRVSTDRKHGETMLVFSSILPLMSNTSLSSSVQVLRKHPHSRHTKKECPISGLGVSYFNQTDNPNESNTLAIVLYNYGKNILTCSSMDCNLN